MKIELRNRRFIRLDNRAQYLFNRYMVTITERSGRSAEREYKIVERDNRDYIVLDGLYYRIFVVDSILTIELSGGAIELVDEQALKAIPSFK